MGLCKCGHFVSDHNDQEGCLGCPCKKGLVKIGLIETFISLINNMNNKELLEAKELLKKEIRLSETAIKEGFELTKSRRIKK